MIKRSNTEWIAVLSADQLRMPAFGDFVCEWFSTSTPCRSTSRACRLPWAGRSAWRLRGKGAVKVDEANDELLGDSRPIRELRKLLGNWRLPNHLCSSAVKAALAGAGGAHAAPPVAAQ